MSAGRRSIIAFQISRLVVQRVLCRQQLAAEGRLESLERVRRNLDAAAVELLESEGHGCLRLARNGEFAGAGRLVQNLKRMILRLTVTNTFAVAELGTVAFVGLEPIPLVFGSRHRVLVTRPDGESVEAVASVEAVRKDSSEFPALLFASLAAGEVVLGSSISVLGEVGDA
jgi:hypothetical protein